MTQSRAVIEAIAQLGGIAPLGKIYEVAVKNPDCKWGTQTPQASIRRIVRHTKGIYVVRKGCMPWSLTDSSWKPMELWK